MKTSIILLVLITLSCSDPTNDVNDKIPNETTEGLGSFGCMVGNKVWLPRQIRFPLSGSLPFLEIFYFEEDGIFEINARREYNTDLLYEDIKIEVDSVFSVGVYASKVQPQILNDPPPTYFKKVYHNTYETYYISESSINRIEVTYLDTVLDIISGTFEMEVFDKTNKKIILQNGVFDLKY